MIGAVLVAFTLSEVPVKHQAGADEHATRLRHDILHNRSYDAGVPPASVRSAAYANLSATGTDVQIQIRIFKVHTVDVAEGTLKLKVWVRMGWSDTRLPWNPAEYGSLVSVMFPNARELWLPDFEVYNGNLGLRASLDEAMATVDNEGNVFWSRPGYLDILCKFSGLVNFPFDYPTCMFEIGGWGLSGIHQGLEWMGGEPVVISNQEYTQGSSYQEYELFNATGAVELYVYEAAGGDDAWPIALYKLTLRRASLFYVSLVCIPQILVTFLSFVVFWAPTAVFNPMQYGISCVIVALLGNIVLVRLLPICGEWLWIDLFSLVNTVFCCISLMQ